LIKVWKRKKASEDVKGIVNHLSELRTRLIIICSFIIASVLISFNFSDDIVNILATNGKKIGYELVYLAPAELLHEYIRLSIIFGITFSSPVILYQTWAFIRPGLKKNENVIVFLSLLGGFICFLAGSIFAFYIAMPLMLKFFVNISKNQIVAATVSIQNYLNFFMSTIITFGIVFEMPVVTVLLSELGLLKTEWLVKSRRLVIVIITVVAAIITPPDVISQIIVIIPMIILFEISVLLSKVIKRRKNLKAEID